MSLFDIGGVLIPSKRFRKNDFLPAGAVAVIVQDGGEDGRVTLTENLTPEQREILSQITFYVIDIDATVAKIRTNFGLAVETPKPKGGVT